MNILVIYTKYPGALGEFLVNAFKKIGHEVEEFDSRFAPRWITKGCFSLPLGKNVNITSIVKKCKQKPDFIFHIDGALRHLSGYKRINIPTVFYAIDSHLTLNFHRNIISDFDFVFAAQKDYIPELKEEKKEVYWLPHACDPNIHKRYESPKLFDIGFIGSMDSRYVERVRLLKILSEKHDVIAINIKFNNMSKIYSQSKIGFNKSLKGDLNMRVFEIMSSGTMLLTDKINNGLNDLFEDKKHLVTYENEEELDELVQYYLENEDEREKIAREGQKEVHEKHTYRHRAEQILKTVKG